MRVISMALMLLVSLLSGVYSSFHTDQNIDVSNPTSYEDFVELLCPILQERGIMQKECMSHSYVLN